MRVNSLDISCRKNCAISMRAIGSGKAPETPFRSDIPGACSSRSALACLPLAHLLELGEAARDLLEVEPPCALQVAVHVNLRH